MKKGKINLHKEFEEENEQTNSYQITFDLSTEQIKAPIYSLVKYSQVVLDEVKKHDIFIKLSNKLKEYQKNKHISKDSIKHFFKILEDDRNDISITNDEFTDLCKLATIFKVKPLENYLKKYLNIHSNDVDFIINLILEDDKNSEEEMIFNSQNTIEMEECLKKNVNECLQNDKFSQIDQSIIYRILEKSEDIDSKILYEFIRKSIEKHHVFFKFLKVEELSDDLFNDLYNNYEHSDSTKHYYEYLPTNLKYIQYMKTEKNKLETRISKIELQMKEERTLKEQQEQLLTKNIEDLNKIISKLREENEKILQINQENQIQINKQKETIDNYQTIEKKVDEQDKIISKYQKDKDELQQTISEKEIKMRELLKTIQLKTEITAKIVSYETIECQINIIERGTKLDNKRSKYIINQNNSSKIGEENYQEGTKISKLNSTFSISKPEGTYFLHAIIIDNYGQTEELISNSLTIKPRPKLFNFEYTGQVQEITLDPGNYKLEVWGASGGENDVECKEQGDNGKTYSGSPGKGGYSVGTLNLPKKTTLYVYVGGSSKNHLGGWNGGGSANSPGAGGGGSTDISLYCSSNKAEWNVDSHLYSRIIVAGGGGGSALATYEKRNQGGYGGGENGESNFNCTGGTQTTGYKFGCGESNTLRHSSGGGGGWYGGCSYNGSGGWGPGGSGGSGFVYNSSTASNYPSGCKLNSAFYLTNSQTISGNTDIPTPDGKSTEKGHFGNGYAKITPQ